VEIIAVTSFAVVGFGKSPFCIDRDGSGRRWTPAQTHLQPTSNSFLGLSTRPYRRLSVWVLSASDRWVKSALDARTAADAELGLAAARCTQGAVVSSGQSCISVQRVFSDRAIAEELANRMAAAAQLTVGDPYDLGTDDGVVMSEQAVDRLAAMISDAIERGRWLLTGGVRGGVVHPKVIYNPPSDADISQMA
jgi:hypothetical protein